MNLLPLLPCLAALTLASCSWIQEENAALAGGAGAYVTMHKLQYTRPEYLAGVLIAYAIYDPLAPTWSIRVTELDERQRRIELDMKRLVTGGEGEARQIFLRVARFLAAEGGYAGYDETGYQEGMDSTRPFARRNASGEIRLVKSRQFPEF
jgi:hypothetical protein